MSTNRLPLPKPCILDSDQFKFPDFDAGDGGHLARIYRLENGEMVRCRMKDIRKGDIFLKLDRDGQCFDDCQGYQEAVDDAWWEPTHRRWGITCVDYMDYEPPEQFAAQDAD